MTIPELLESIPAGMLDFIADGLDDSYAEKDVAECMTILHAYLAEIEKAEDATGGLAAVKVAVLKLNELNEQCDAVLIETDQREQIAELIQLAFVEQAFVVPESGDVTEEWREW